MTTEHLGDRHVAELVETLGRFNVAEVDIAISQLQDGPRDPQSRSYDAGAGDEVEVETEGAVELDEFGCTERIILPEENLLPVHLLTGGTVVQNALARAVVSTPGWVGTRFMVSPTLFLTNNHVIQNQTHAENALMRSDYWRDHFGNGLSVDQIGTGLAQPGNDHGRAP